jgi:hypothetical protein
MVAHRLLCVMGMNRTIRMLHVRRAPTGEADDLAKTNVMTRGADFETMHRIARVIAAQKRATARIQEAEHPRTMELAHARSMMPPPGEVQLLGYSVAQSWIVAIAVVLTVDIIMGCAALVSNYVTPLM